jgi:mono/diheme cytochrome c family protein
MTVTSPPTPAVPHPEPVHRHSARRARTGPPVRAAALAAVLAAAALAGAGCDVVFPKRSEGEKLWREYCAECHGLGGAGNTPRYMGKPYADLLDNVWRLGGETGTLQESTRNGFFGEMPAFDHLSDEEIRLVVDYLRGLRGEIAPGSAR